MGNFDGIAGLVLRHVLNRPHASVIHDCNSNETLTYRQLWSASGAVAAYLDAHGTAPGDVVAVAGPRSVETVVAMLGIVRSGACYLALDEQWPDQRAVAVLDDASVSVVLTTDRELPAVRQPSARIRAAVSTCIAERSDSGESPEPYMPMSPDDPVYIAYTSGTTGGPKGVVIPHRAVRRLVVDAAYCTIDIGDRVAFASNPAFDATTFEVWGTLVGGGTLVVFPSVADLNVGSWSEAVRREQIDALFLTTSLFHMIAREDPGAMSSVGTVVVGGEQLDLRLTQRVLDSEPPRRLVNGYGPTETTTFATHFDCTAGSLAGLERIPIGFAIQETTASVRDAEARPVARGESGELYIGGPGVGLGYLNRPELSAEKFVPDPEAPDDTAAKLYRTGDLVRMRPDGALELIGRADRQIKLRGFRIELEEIERAVLDCDLVDIAALECRGSGPSARLACVVIPAVGAAADDGELVTALETNLQKSLPPYMIPRQWRVFRERMPTGPTGKLDRDRLFAGWDEPDPQESGGTPPDGTPANWLCAVIADLLPGTAAVPADNFIDLGGNSILAMQLSTRIQFERALNVEPADILLSDSLADLADQLTAAEAR